jgi:peroxiredoxin
VLFLTAITLGFGQNVSISGVAHQWYAGKVIRLAVSTDYITNTPRFVTSDTIDPQGRFELLTQADFTHPLTLRVENVFADLYVEPGKTYSVTLPEPSEKVAQFRDTDHPINIGVISADPAELNALVFDYSALYNQMFIPDDNRFLSRPAMFKRADSLQKLCELRYKEVKNNFFKSYVEYSIASINASVSRGENYLIKKYILQRPVLYDHSEYMHFFNACFRGYLNVVASQFKGESLYHLINVRSDKDQLDLLLKQDELLKNDTLRELVMISNLWDFYFSSEFVSDAVSNLVSQINVATNIRQHREITSSMLSFFNKMQEGSDAPDFAARTRDGKMGTLSSFKGKWVYLNFFSTRNTESLKEMPKILSLIKTYGHKVVFVSICVDDSLSAYKTFLKNNPKYNWNIWFNSDPSLTETAREKYYVTGSEAYFLISNQGYLALSPAPAPSKGIQYRFNIIFKIKEKTHKTGIR